MLCSTPDYYNAARSMCTSLPPALQTIDEQIAIWTNCSHQPSFPWMARTGAPECNALADRKRGLAAPNYYSPWLSTDLRFSFLSALHCCWLPLTIEQLQR